MSETTASIIINNYNYGRFLGAAIDSALTQAYPYTEVIVVDDGSTDDSHAVIARYGNRVASVLQPNQGQGSALNAGFRLSRGDVICFLDSDDMLLPSAIEQAVLLLRNPHVVKVQWTMRMIDEVGRDLGKVIPERTPPEGDLRVAAIQEGPCYDWLLTPPTSGTAYSRSILSNVLPMPEPEYRVGADEYLTSLAPLYGDVKSILSPQGCYRKHDRNNYCGRSLDDACLLEYVQRFKVTCQAMRAHLERQGITADIERWEQGNFNYLWPTRLLQARREIASCVPPGDQFVLVDQNEWGGYAAAVPGRLGIPFCERHGEYWGAPENDDMAIGELQRLCRAGARYIVFWWTAYWWFAQYPKLVNYLNVNADCVVRDESTTIFRVHA